MRNMFSRSRRLRELSRRLETFEPYETTESGDRLIRLHVNDVDYFLSPLSVDGVPCISDDTAFLLNYYLKNMSADSDEKLFFEITGNSLSPGEKKLYTKAIKNYYREEFLDIQEQLKQNRKKSLLMTVLGILLIALRIAVPLFFSLRLDYFEPVNVVAWVFLWEAVELLIFKRPKLREMQIRNLKILEANIQFKEQTGPEDIF